MSDSTSITRQPAWGDALIRQPGAPRVLTRQPSIPMDYVANPRWVVAVAAPEDSAILWVTSDQNTTGTGDQVDTWDTRSSSGLTLTEGGAGKPLQLGRRVDLDNESTQTNFFTVGTTSTFEAITSTGVFTLAWRGTVDVLDGLNSGVNGMLLVTKSNTRGFFLGYNSTLMNFTATNSSNSTLFQLLDNDWAADVEFGAPHDYVIQGDGTTVRMYRNGVEVDSDTISTQSGSHQLTPRVGISANSGAYQIGSIEGIFYDDEGPATYSVSEARALVTVARTFQASDYGTVIAEYSARWGYKDASAVARLVDESGNGHVLTPPSGSNEGTYDATDVAIDFDGNDYYRGADRVPFDGLHQTPQGSVVVRFTPVAASSGLLQIFFSTSNFSSSSRGAIVAMDDRSAVGGGNKLRLYIPRAVGGTEVYDTLGASISPTLVAGTPTVLVFAWDATDVRIYQDGVLLDTDTPSGDAPSGLTSTSLPEVGAAQANFELVDSLHDAIVFSDKLDASDVSSLTTALEAEYV